MSSVFRNPVELAAFKADVTRLLRADYMGSDGQQFKGQSLTHLQQCLRDRHDGRKWVLGGGYWGLQDGLREAGFKVVRARTMRWTRKGEYKPYQECSVVTL